MSKINSRNSIQKGYKNWVFFVSRGQTTLVKAALKFQKYYKVEWKKLFLMFAVDKKGVTDLTYLKGNSGWTLEKLPNSSDSLKVSNFVFGN